MIHVEVPGGKELFVEHVVMDYNGTLACDGKLPARVGPLFEELSRTVRLHVITADTFGVVEKQLASFDLQLTIIEAKKQDELKRDYIRGLGAEKCLAIGNGKNDRMMLKEAALGIVLIQQEGAAVETLIAADIAMTDIEEALRCLIVPKRLTATLRI